jgi:hypothetical protein
VLDLPLTWFPAWGSSGCYSDEYVKGFYDFGQHRAFALSVRCGVSSLSLVCRVFECWFAGLEG